MTAPADEAALAARLSIEPHHLALVRQILARLLPGREVWASVHAPVAARIRPSPGQISTWP